MSKKGKLLMSALICCLPVNDKTTRRGQQSQVVLLTGETGDQSAPCSDLID